MLLLPADLTLVLHETTRGMDIKIACYKSTTKTKQLHFLNAVVDLYCNFPFLVCLVSTCLSTHEHAHLYTHKSISIHPFLCKYACSSGSCISQTGDTLRAYFRSWRQVFHTVTTNLHKHTYERSLLSLKSQALFSTLPSTREG